MGRMAIGAGIGVLLAAACWIVFANGHAAPPTVPGEATPVPAAPAPAVPAAVDAAAADAAATARTSAPELAPSDVPAVPADAKWVEVLVVDKPTGKPVADAEAWWSDETQWAPVAKLPPAERDAAYRDREGVARRFGWHARSDREGRLRVNLGKNGTQVFAQAGTRYGETWLRVDEESKDVRRVVLEEDASLSVRVLDAASRPVAGVPLSLEVHDAKQTRSMNIGGELTSGADGMATFRHVQSRRTVAWGDQRGQPVAQWRVWVGIPRIELAPVLVDAQAPPSEPVEVRLPPTGRLRAKVTFGGRRVPGLEYLSFHAGPKDSTDAWNSAWTKRIDADGWVRFPVVPLAKTLFVNGQPGHWDFEIAGPTVVDQEVVAELELAGEMVALVGRLLRADGTPLAATGVQGTFEAWNSSGGLQINTDDAGRFVFFLGRPRPENTTEMKLKRLVLDLHSAESPVQRVEVPPRDLTERTNDLGDLRFGIAALVVGGRLTFDTPGTVRPWLQVQRANAERTRGGGETVRWDGVDGIQPLVREDGTFEARGTVAAGRYRVFVHPNGCLPAEPVEFAVGATDVTIAIRRGSPLAATCLLPPGLDAQRVVVRLQPPASAPAAPKGEDWFRRREDPLRGQGWEMNGAETKYRWPALESGTYVLRVESPGLAEPLLTVPDVVVPAPEGGDARLAPLDLRDAIATLRVQVQVPPPSDERRGRGQDVYVFPQPQADDREWSGVQTNGEVVLAVPKRPVDLVIASSGLRPATVRGATGSVAVTLEPWPTVEVRVLGAEALPAGAQLYLSARAAGKPVRDSRRYVLEYASGGLDGLIGQPTSSAAVADGLATLAVGDGAFDLGVYLLLEKRGSGTSLKQFSPSQVVAGAPVTVQLDADEVRAVVERLQRENTATKK